MQTKIFIKNKRGLKLAAVIEKPAVKQKCPCVILLHGFKGYKEEDHYTSLAHFLLTKDIASVRFDTSGFGESEGRFEKDYRFSNYVKDVESVYKYIMGGKWVDKQRIGVFGQSMGGMQAIVFAANNPSVKAVATVSPPDLISYKEIIKRLGGVKKEKHIEIESSRMGGKISVPLEFFDDAEKWNMTKYVIKIKAPILIMLGLKDTAVLPERTRKVYYAANQPKQLIEVQEMNHFYKRDSKMLKKVNKKVVNFFTNNL